MLIFYLATFVMIYLCLPAFAPAEDRKPVELEPVVVTASKIEEPLSETPASIEVVTHQDIRVKQNLTLSEAVRSIPGLIIRTYGGADPWSSVNIRGTENNHSLIMIDGVKINPPYSQKPLAGALLLNNVERVEVIKGSYSALYGSEAIGGVVNVITAERPGLAYFISGGTFKTFNGGLLYSGIYKDASYNIGYERLSTAGFEFSGPYWNNALQGKISLPLSITSTLQLSTNYWDWKKYDYTICCEIDGSGNVAFIIDKDSYTREDNWLSSAQLTQYPSGWWDYNIRLSRYITNSHLNNPLNPVTPERPFPLDIDSDIRSERDTLEMQHNFYPDANNIVTLGLQYTWEEIKKEEFGNLTPPPGMGPSMKQPVLKADRISRAIYLQELFKIRRQISFTAGARFENGPGFNSELIPKVSALYVLPAIDTRFHISYGEGIRAPSLEELYHPVQGNTALKPEKSTSLEVGFKQPLIDGRIWLEATGFILRLKDLIDVGISGDPTAPVFINIGRSKIKGAEANLQFTITEKLQGNIGYTGLSTKNIDTGEELPFRPRYRWTGEVQYKPVTKLVLYVNTEFVGESFNPLYFLVGLDGKSLSERVASYKVVNMAAAYNIVKGDPILGSLDVTLKLNNIFGEDYVELPGFRNYGFNFLAGIRSLY